MTDFTDNNGIILKRDPTPRSNPIELLSRKGSHTYGTCPQCNKIYSFSEMQCPECHLSLTPDNFSDDGKIDPVEVDKYAKILEQRNVYLAVGKEETLYVYKDGVFVSKDAELILKKDLNQLVNLNRHWQAEIINKVKMDTLTSESELDQDLMTLTLQNKNYNLITKETTELTPRLKTTIQLPVKLNLNATCPKTQAFLEQIQPDKEIRDTIWEMFGYCLYRKTSFEKAFIFIGKGANGKSQVLDILSLMLGRSNIVNVSLQSLANEENKFVVGKLYRKFANIYDDLNNKSLQDTGILKIISSKGQITADRKFQEHIDFINYAKLIFSCNEPPKISDNSDGFYRRWLPIKFKIQIPPEKQVKDFGESLFQEEKEGILAEAIKGFDRLDANKRFTYQPSIEEVRKEYQLMTDSVAAFAESCIEQNTDNALASITKPELHEVYVNYCTSLAITPNAIKKFGKQLKIECPWLGESRSGNIKSWVGLKLSEKDVKPPKNKVQSSERYDNSTLVPTVENKGIDTNREKSHQSTQSEQQPIDPKFVEKIHHWLNDFIHDYGFTGFTQSSAIINGSLVFGQEAQKILEERINQIKKEGGLIEKEIEGKKLLRSD